MSTIYFTVKEPDCSNCPYRRHMVGIGYGIWCSNKENQGKDLGFGIHKIFKYPLLGFSKPFVCDHYGGTLKFKITHCKIEDLPDLPPYPFVEEELKRIKS